MSCETITGLKVATLNVNGLKQSCQKVWDAKYDAANVLHLLEHLRCGTAAGTSPCCVTEYGNMKPRIQLTRRLKARLGSNSCRPAAVLPGLQALEV
jgi:hypothetical protein